MAGVFLPASIFFLILLYRKIKNGMTLVYLSLFSISTAMLFTLGNITEMVENLIFLIVMVLTFLSFIKNKLGYLKLIGMGIVLALLINASSIISAYELNNSNISFGYYNFLKIGNAFSNANIFNAIYYSTLSAYSYVISSIIIFLICIIALVKLVEKDHYRKSRPVIITFFIIFFVLVFLYMNLNAPFGQIYSFILAHFKEIYAIRSGLGLFYQYYFVYAILFAYGLSNLNKLVGPKIKIIIGFIVLLVLGVHSYYSNYLPFTHNYNVALPTYVINISNYINSKGELLNVALLPGDNGFQHLATWYTGTDVYTYLITKPVFTGGYSKNTEIFYPITKYEYDIMAYQIDTNLLLNKRISNGLGVFGIGYLIVQGDSVMNSPADPGYYNVFSFNAIYNNLNAPDILFVNRWGNSSLYRNTNYVKLVYGSNIKNGGRATTQSIFNAVENSSFDIQNTALYSTNIPELYNDSMTINASSISDFSQPNVTFDYNTPTHAFVYVRNATTPYYLVFRETYDPYWHAYYSNGTAVPSRDHIAVNGFANAWYIDKPGNYTISLYYTLQTEAWIAWIISFAGLGITLYIGYLGWKEMKKEKGVEGMLNRIERKGSGR